MIFLLIYIWACAGVQFIGLRYDQFEGIARATIDEHFSDLSATFVSLISVVNLDSAAAKYTPLINAEPQLMVYFLSFILLVPIAVMNLLTSVIVES